MNTSIRDVLASPPLPTLYQRQRIAAGDQQTCRELIDRWEQTIRAIASGYASRRSDLDDLMQMGRIAVYHAALNYDPSFEVPFGNYAKRAIKNAVMQEAVRLAHQRRLETSLDERFDSGDNSPEEIADETDRTRPIKEWVLELSEPYASIFRLLYAEKLKQRAAAVEMGISQPRVAQINRNFLALARAAFAS
jgi:RNA polymerase sporulation-specific sigma factor